MNKVTTPAVAIGLLASILSIHSSDGALECDSTAFCEETLRPGSVCLEETGTCSNPFQRGCLATLLPDQLDDQFTIRICNSDDVLPDAIEQGLCYVPDFDYEELRIHNGNWESSIFLSWVMQILLMEVVQVPVTVGLGPDTSASSFYNKESNLAYSSAAYPFSALEEASEVGDCRLTTNECSHVMPEVWNGQQHEWIRALGEGIIDPPEGNGQVGKGSWYVPSFTARRDDSLVSVFGLSGESNRAKLAEAFRRPTSWMEYCEDVSTTNCTEPDEIASRYPETADEQALYFAGPGSYIGHFRLTDANNCTANPTTCAGHIVGPPCSWSTNVDSQLYWNDVKLVPDGPVMPNGGYEYGSMLQIWRAANWTKSNVVFWWWKPDALVEEYHGTDSQFQQILLPEATDICQSARVDTEARCSEDIMVRRGVAEGACDQEAHALQKIFVSSFRDRVYDVPKASRSPSYDLLQNLKINDLEVNNMIRRWLENGVDKYGNDAREAVCGWVTENLDSLLDSVPEGYPRILSYQSKYDVGHLHFARAMGAFTACVVIAVAAMIAKYRKTKVFVVAQAYLCWLILSGFFLVSLGSIITSLEPSNFACTLRIWLVTLGYTIEIVPLLVKIAAINTILQSAKKMKRVKISPRRMLKRVGVVVAGVTTFLLVWTILDAPEATEFLRLESERSQVVLTSLICSSPKYDFWYLVGLGWQILLLVIASVLAFQSRNVVQEFNESRSLGNMVYSHSLFVLCRSILFLLGRQSDSELDSSYDNSILNPNVAATLDSLLLSWDTIFALGIYVFPKILEAKVAPQDYDPRKHGSLVRNASLAVSNLSLIESRAAEAQRSYISSRSVTESTTNDGGSSFGGWPSLRRIGSRRSSGQRNTSLRSSQNSSSIGGFRGSQASVESKNVFSAGMVPTSPRKGPGTMIRVSMVQEGSCEISKDSGLASSFENNSSRRLSSQNESARELISQNGSAKQLSSPNNSSRQLTTAGNSQRRLSSEPFSLGEEPQTCVVEESNCHEVSSDDDSSRMSSNDVKGTRWQRLSNNSSVNRFLQGRGLGVSSLHSLSLEGSLDASSGHSRASREEFGGDEGDCISSSSSDEHDVGGPRWSKPELNKELNRSVRSIDENRLSSSGGRRRYSSSFTRPKLLRARDFKPMPVIRSVSIDMPEKAPKTEKKATDSELLQGVPEDATHESPVRASPDSGEG